MRDAAHAGDPGARGGVRGTRTSPRCRKTWMLSVAAASGSLETETFSTGEVTRISEAIRDRGLTAVDVVRALEKRGFAQEAENLLLMLRQRISGDYLQTSAILRDGKVISALNDPNDYRGPGSGYRMSRCPLGRGAQRARPADPRKGAGAGAPRRPDRRAVADRAAAMRARGPTRARW